ncbi:hypothetical protein [Nocardia rhizosphaerae]|uniref:Uncharacterized protein n=1 Tax=Nocardia rhizosphaerae TaxID=1691571 RepID=A0ABV8KY69_9NOCA
MPEQTCDPTPAGGRRARHTAPGSGLALCGLGIRPRRPGLFSRAAGVCAEQVRLPPDSGAEPGNGTEPHRPEGHD